MSIYNDTPQSNKQLVSLEQVPITDQLSSLLDLNDNIIFISGEIDEHTLVQFIMKVRILDFHNAPEFINVVINSPGGDLLDALGIIDFMESSSIKFNTICRGAAYSAAAMILLAGTGTRVASKRSSIMLHQPSHDHGWMTTSDLTNISKYSQAQLAVIYELLEQRTNKDTVWWADKLRTDFWLSAQDALELNIIDQII